MEKNFLEYTLGDALQTAGIGMGTVIAVLALIAVCVLIISKIIRTAESKRVGKTEAAPVAQATPVAAAPVSNSSNGSVELVDVDEKTAAVIMAIVSNESGIELNRLAFKSIKLMED